MSCLSEKVNFWYPFLVSFSVEKNGNRVLTGIDKQCVHYIWMYTSALILY